MDRVYTPVRALVRGLWLFPSSAAFPPLSIQGSPGNATRTGTTAWTVSQWPVSILSKALVEMDEIVAWGSLTAARSTRWRSISASRLLTGSC